MQIRTELILVGQRHWIRKNEKVMTQRGLVCLRPRPHQKKRVESIPYIDCVWFELRHTANITRVHEREFCKIYFLGSASNEK